MIRTISVSLSTLPAAIAYRRKGSSGGSSIVIIRADEPQPGIATISKTSGEPIISVNTPKDSYPIEAFSEAIALTAGMPYRKLGRPGSPGLMPTEPEEDDTVAEEEEILVDTREYQALLDAFTDKKGKFSFKLMNKDLIQLAHYSPIVKKMIAHGEAEDEILAYVVGTRMRTITGNPQLTSGQVTAMSELLDEITPQGAFKELKSKIRSMLVREKNRTGR